ncbi:LysR family transcriptional regulator [Ammoniphilus sp. CFH 90114]|uniref:LysR family transcriptional regulator n=1 Tax=Ammoniphilus sp. CFH 90114 TaxID=2493665 RepID=UPI00100DC876|nr:LysR family transcriptional regulator [Ammoniphilus sp. CFH 90114]RXT06555.1 LysR family transcriptional regulator [Ammoniphilus sp. CFH 90114]
MNFEQLEAFIYVAETRSFSKAGDILFLSQPSVSSRVKSLEDQMGCSLFNRSSQGISLTIAGETFLPYAQKLLQYQQEGMLSVDNVKNHYKGELSFSSVLIAANYIIPDIIHQFHYLYPQIKTTIHTGHSKDILNMVLERQVPLGIARSISHPLIESMHLIDDEMILVVYPQHHYSSRDTISIEEVATEPLILFNRGSLDWTLIHSAFKRLAIKPNVIMEVDSIEVAKKVVSKKTGIAILPKFAVEEELKSNELREVVISNIPKINRPFELIYLKESTFDENTKLFKEFLIKAIKEGKRSK